MEIYAPNYYDKNRNIIEEQSGVYVMGLFASLDGVAIVIVKVFADISRWDFIAEFVTSDGDADTCKAIISEFVEQYQIEYFLGNDIASSLINKKSSLNKKGEVISGWETITLGSEHMLFLVRNNLKNLRVKAELSIALQYDLKNFNLREVRLNQRHYPRISAIASVIQGAKPDYNRMLFT